MEFYIEYKYKNEKGEIVVVTNSIFHTIWDNAKIELDAELIELERKGYKEVEGWIKSNI
jgi:hypothetical protein